MTLEKNLVAYYRLEDLLDVSGNGYNLTNNNTVAFSSGKINNGADFGSSDNHNKRLSYATGLGVDLTGNTTIGFWIKLNATVGAERRIIQWESTTGTSRTLLITYDGTNLKLGYGGGGTDISVAYTLTVGTWYYIVATATSAGVTELFVNNSSIGTGTRGTNTGSNFFYAGGANSGTLGTPCIIDELGIWSRVLTSTERTSLYNSGSGNDFTGLTTGIRSYWKLNEASGNGEDAISGNTAVNVNTITYGTGKIGNAADLNGTTQKFTCGTTLASAYATITMNAWVKTDALGNFRRILSKTDNTTYNQMIRMTNGNKIAAHISTSSEATITGGTSITTGVWYMVTVTYDGTNIRLYLNGVEDATPVAQSGALKTASDTFVMGCTVAGAASEFWDGMIDEPAVWSRALTSAEVTELYNSGNGNDFIELTTQIVSYWDLDESSGNASDSVASNDLTNVGSMAYAAGKLANGADFEASGADQWLTIAHATQQGLSITGNMTLSAWVKPESLPSSGNAMVIVEKGLGTGNTENYSLRLLNSGGTQQIEFFTYSDAIGSAVGATYIVTLTTGTWYHIVGRRDGTTWKMYVNGAQVASTTNSQAPVTSDAAFFIGARGGDVQHFDGMIDEVGIWSRPLLLEEIVELYNGGTGFNPIATSVTVSPSAQVVTSSLPARTVTTGVVVSPSAQVARFLKSGIEQQGRAYLFDGSDDFVAVGAAGNITGFKGYVRLVVDDQNIWGLDGTTGARIRVTGGVLTFGPNLTGTSIMVDGVSKTGAQAGALLNDNTWHYLEVSFNTFNATNLMLGRGTTGAGVNGNIQAFGWEFYNGSTLVALYKMDEQAGTTCYDSSGNGYNGTIANATLGTFHSTQDIYSYQNVVGYSKPSTVFIPRNEAVPTQDVLGNPLEYTGITYSLTVGTGVTKAASTPVAYFNRDKYYAILNGTTSFGQLANSMGFNSNTLTAFARIKSTATSGNRTILAKYDTNGNRRSWQMFLSGAASSAQISFRFGSNVNGGYLGQWDSTSSYNFSTDRSVAFTFNNGTFKVFLDGVEIAGSGVSPASALYANTATPITVGARLNTAPATTEYHQGNIWDIKLLDEALSSADVLKLHNKEAISSTVDIEIPVNEGTGSTSVDIGTGARDITWTSITWGSTSIVRATVSAGTGTTRNPSAQVATFSIPAYTLIAGSTAVSPNAQELTFTIPPYTPAVQRYINVGATQQSLVFDIPAYTIAIEINASVNAQVATFDIPEYEAKHGSVLAASTQVATFSIPEFDAFGITNVFPTTQAGTFSIPEYDLLYDKVVFPSTQELLFSIPPLYKFGAVWAKTPRATSSSWDRTARNST